MKAQNKTIGIVINTSWNIYNFRIGLLKSLHESGYKIITIAPTDQYTEKLQALGFEHHNININNKGTNPFEDILLVWSFYKLYKNLKLDLLLHYTIKPNIYGTIAAKLNGTPVISNISGLGTVFLNKGLSSSTAKFLYKIALRFPRKVFFQNNDDKSLFIDSKLVIENITGLLPGSGIDTSTLVPLQNEYTNANTPITFLFIARLVKDKGLVEYVDAARILKLKYPAVIFNILGAFYPGNPSAISNQQMVDWQDEKIINYLGVSNDVPTYIDQSDCVVLPSYREGLSRVLLEAASMAKPIVTTDVPGCRDVVDDGVNGFLCQVKSAESLSQQMEKIILLKQSDRIKMGRKGREKAVSCFDERLVINQYLSAIDQILI